MSIGDWVGKPAPPKETPWEGWPLPDCRIGLEYEFEDPAGGGKPDRKSPVWGYFELHADGSLRDTGLEFCLKAPLLGLELKQAIDTIHAARGRLASTYRTSLHVHVDVRDLELEQLQSLCFLYALTEKYFYAYANEFDETREASNYCIPWYFSDGYLQAVAGAVFSAYRASPTVGDKFDAQVQQIERYAGMNLAAIKKFGSLEFRHMPTVTQPEVVYNWVKMCMSLKACALSRPLRYWKEAALYGSERVKREVFGTYNVTGVPGISEEDFDTCFSTATLVESFMSVRDINFRTVPGVRGKNIYHAQAAGEEV